MSRPILLDLFCGAGGAAWGYHLAGFDVVGVDIKPQPNYPFRFVQADAMSYSLVGIDAIHASPPCQRWSKSVSKKHRAGHPDFLSGTRERLVETGLPYVIENVPGAPLHDPLILCGSMFGLDVRRHRLFESNVELGDPPPCRHYEYEPRFAPAWNRTTLLRFRPISGGWTGDNDHELDKAAMGVTWDVTPRELQESIPPAYTEWIGHRLAEELP